MNENTRFRSISRKLRLNWYGQKAAAYLGFDILYIVAFFALWLWQTCDSAGIPVDKALRSLKFTADKNLSFWKGLAEVQVRIGDTVMDTNGIFAKAALVLVMIIAVQIVELICEFGAGYRRSQKLLAPIRQMANAAAEAAAVVAAPEMLPEYQQFMHAVDDFNPDTGDGLLHSGIPELAQLETSVNELLSRIRAANAGQARFVSDASHELRTPIAVIQGYANMLDRWGSNDPEVLKEGIAAIKSESEQMKVLVDQLLFLARGDSGRQPLQIKPFLLEDLAREIHEEFCMIDQNHKFELTVNGSFPVQADFGLLKQAVRILTDNAVKYTPAGGTVSICVAAGNEGEPTVSVQDTGCGIEKEHVNRVFDRFFRADPTRQQTEGTGLGLSIADWIVKRHNGYFTLTSVPNIGSRFTVHLPQK